jgi:agmatine deiminase
MGGVLIAYPGTIVRPKTQIQLPPTGPHAFGIPNDLIIRMQQLESEQPVQIFIMCADQNERKNVIDNLKTTASTENLEFDPDLIHFVPWDTDSYWTRDYGPWWVENKDTGYFGIAKHLYTSLGGGSVGLVEGAEHVDPREGSGIFRPNDDYGADRFSDFLNAPIRKWNDAKWNETKQPHPIEPHNWYNTGLLDVGGNYMVTSEGIIASSYLVATQNELPTHEEEQLTDPDPATIRKRMEYILEQLNRFMGISEYIVLTDPSGTYIGHIDCWGKFLDNRKVLIAESEDERVNAAYDVIADFFVQNGFEAYRVLCQNIYVPIADQPATTAAYTNSLILNDHVYVPMAGERYAKYDERALSVYGEALPNHTIVGIIGKPQAPWLGTDALHCRTRGVPRAVVDNWLESQLLKD